MFPVIFQEKSVQPKAPMIWMMYGHMRLPGLGAFCASNKCVLQPRHYYHYYQPTDAIKHRPKPLQKHNGELANTTKAKNTGELLQKKNTSSDRKNTNLSVQVAQHPHGSSQRRQRLKLGDNEAFRTWRNTPPPHKLIVLCHLLPETTLTRFRGSQSPLVLARFGSWGCWGCSG
jgi:hypothetical protein